MNLSNQIEYRKVSGSATTTTQSFYSNKNVNLLSGGTTVDSIDSPMYYSFGGTQDYYGQDPQAVFTNMNAPFIRFYFTANTYSISGDTEFVHEIYKLDNETYKNYNTTFDKIDSKNINQTNQLTERQVVTQNGKTTITDITKSSKNILGTETFINTGATKIDEIQRLLQDPYYKYVVPSSAMTFPIYDLILGEFIKTSGTTAGSYTKKLFDDKSQYFVKSFFRYKILNDVNEFDTYKIYNNNNSEDLISTIGYDAKFYPSYFVNLNENSLNSSSTEVYTITKYPTISASTYEDRQRDVEITTPTFNGTVVGGNFFAYFTVPNKPKFESPVLSGQTDTFSPKVFFSNVEDGDEYVIEVTYDLQDTGYTNNKVVYNVSKNLSVDTKIQEVAFSMKTNSNFMYRVGNVKKLTNVFDVKQKITTFSNNLTGSTQVEPPQLYIFAESDSPSTTQISIAVTPPSVFNQAPGNYNLILNVSGSTVTGATITLQDPINNILTGVTNLVGNISFSGLTVGNYLLTTEYRGYDTYIQQFELSENKEINYNIEILWDNEHDMWESKESDIILF